MKETFISRFAYSLSLSLSFSFFQLQFLKHFEKEQKTPFKEINQNKLMSNRYDDGIFQESKINNCRIEQKLPFQIKNYVKKKN
jgi:hypothetical protein